MHTGHWRTQPVQRVLVHLCCGLHLTAPLDQAEDLYSLIVCTHRAAQTQSYKHNLMLHLAFSLSHHHSYQVRYWLRYRHKVCECQKAFTPCMTPLWKKWPSALILKTRHCSQQLQATHPPLSGVSTGCQDTWQLQCGQREKQSCPVPAAQWAGPVLSRMKGQWIWSKRHKWCLCKKGKCQQRKHQVLGHQN